MRQIVALTLALGLSVAPAMAQDNDTEITDGFNLMEEGARMLMRGLMSEVEPAITGLRDSLEDMAPELGEFVVTMGPALSDLLNQVDDFNNYQAPEFLPNGDIIIRRKPDAPIWVPESDTGEIEL
ncbi:AAA+ family ATPase [Cognatiyoonia sp. IB215446]|uniref:AAA+ family ATPase n=1 Tax=Cognatiyoonia sp. IB215446 TaxID=3097355 RepID=UPI002A16906C|nr:AAA+ family ATPase [Cognatiyoonia sp. IB215446]MDX8347624.1 AAA+ family ATPase [Cognatiyoonia sp. IB215446]